MRLLKKFLILEETSDITEGIYAYVQICFACYDGENLSYKNIKSIFEKWCIYGKELFSIADATKVLEDFNIIKYGIEHYMEKNIVVTTDAILELYKQLKNTDIVMTKEMQVMFMDSPKNLKEIAEYHIKMLEIGIDGSVARAITFFQCINANMPPFIISIHNRKVYERYVKDMVNKINKTTWLFKAEQEMFYNETSRMLKCLTIQMKGS